MNLLAAHNLVVFTLCSRQVSASHPEKSADHEVDGKDENLRKGSKEQASVVNHQNGILASGSSDNTSHTILKNSLEAKNGTTVEYEVEFVKKDGGGVAYHLTMAKKASPAKLAEMDIPGESGQVDGVGGEGEGQDDQAHGEGQGDQAPGEGQGDQAQGEGQGDQAQGQGQGDQVDEVVTRDTEYWYGAPPLRESGPKILTGNIFASGERFKPQRINYEAAGKGNHDTAIKGNQDAAVKGNLEAAVEGNHDAAVEGNHDAAIKGNQDTAVKGNHFLLPLPISKCTHNPTGHKSTNSTQVKGNHDAAVKGDKKDHKLKINRQHKV